jgi:phage baseplate assembly protein W
MRNLAIAITQYTGRVIGHLDHIQSSVWWRLQTNEDQQAMRDYPEP